MSQLPTPHELMKLAHAITRDHVPRPVRDSEEFADVCLALHQESRRYDPDRGEFSTYAYTVGLRALARGRAERSRRSVPASSAPEGFDAASTADPFYRTEVLDEYQFVLRTARLTPIEHASLHSNQFDPTTVGGRHRASAKVEDSAERRAASYS